MIGNTLTYLTGEISWMFDDLMTRKGEPITITPPFVKLLNVASEVNDTFPNVMLTLVNIEEEKTLKNGSVYEQNNSSTIKKNPTIFLNLYLLFSCNDSGSSDDKYKNPLQNISHLIEAIQSKNVFTRENTMSKAVFPQNVEKIILDLFTLNFEQINHLWGVLGSKYKPSVLYKARLIAIQASNLGPVATIEEIATNN